MNQRIIYTPDQVKEFAFHIKVRGAYVQTPNPGIHGLGDEEILSSADATALYPISQVGGNIGYETVRERLYETNMVQPTITLIKKVFQAVHKEPTHQRKLAIINSAVVGFRGGLGSAIKEFFKRKKHEKKQELLAFSIEYYGNLIQKILMYSLSGNLEDIFCPKTDQQYYLLRSYLYPILETVTWINKYNPEYSPTIVDYIFHNDEFMDRYENKTFFILTEINSTKLNLIELDVNQLIELFNRRILNPYGVLFNKHQDKLTFEVYLILDSLKARKIGKDKKLLLASLISQFEKISKDNILLVLSGKVTKEIANDILDEIGDTEERIKRIDSFIGIPFKINKQTEHFDENKKKLLNYFALKESQYHSFETGIKVSLNSGYGLFGLITFPWASQIIANSITSAGKIFGVKLFQAITADVIKELDEDIKEGLYQNTVEFIPRHPEFL